MDLSKIENRLIYKEKCERELIDKLRAKLNLAQKIDCQIGEFTIKFWTSFKEEGQYDFASGITIYLKDETIEVSSTGAFNPIKEENLAAKWRLIHTAEFLNNWEYVMQAIKEYHKKVMILFSIPITE